MKICDIDNCNNPTRSQKAVWCAKHYQRFIRHGDPLVKLQAANGEPADYLISKLLELQDAPTDECVEWPFGTSGGYGTFRLNGKRVEATHYALGMNRPEGMEALHSCDNPSCFNPQHLRWG